MLARMRKALAAPIGAVLGWALLVVNSPSGPITAHEWVALAIGVAGAFGITYLVPNRLPRSPGS